MPWSRLSVLALLGFGLGAALRSSADAAAALFGLLFISTLLTALLPRPGRTGSPATCP
jgi:ABC-2 type transport system permease protein